MGDADAGSDAPELLFGAGRESRAVLGLLTARPLAGMKYVASAATDGGEQASAGLFTPCFDHLEEPAFLHWPALVKVAPPPSRRIPADVQFCVALNWPEALLPIDEARARAAARCPEGVSRPTFATGAELRDQAHAVIDVVKADLPESRLRENASVALRALMTGEPGKLLMLPLVHALEDRKIRPFARLQCALGLASARVFEPLARQLVAPTDDEGRQAAIEAVAAAVLVEQIGSRPVIVERDPALGSLDDIEASIARDPRRWAERLLADPVATRTAERLGPAWPATRPYLLIRRGTAWQALGQTEKALASYEEALGALRPGPTRDRVARTVEALRVRSPTG